VWSDDSNVPAVDDLVNGRDGRSVDIAVVFAALEELSLQNFTLDLFAGHEKVVLSFHFVRFLRPRRIWHKVTEIAKLFKQPCFFLFLFFLVEENSEKRRVQ
jgi:hypothetical protein